MDIAIFADVEPEVDTLVNGKARDQAMLMVDMGAQRTHTVRGEYVILHIFLFKKGKIIRIIEPYFL